MRTPYWLTRLRVALIHQTTTRNFTRLLDRYTLTQGTQRIR
jgi:hypothetical protein